MAALAGRTIREKSPDSSDHYNKSPVAELVDWDQNEVLLHKKSRFASKPSAYWLRIVLFLVVSGENREKLQVYITDWMLATVYGLGKCVNDSVSEVGVWAKREEVGDRFGHAVCCPYILGCNAAC